MKPCPQTTGFPFCGVALVFVCEFAEGSASVNHIAAGVVTLAHGHCIALEFVHHEVNVGGRIIGGGLGGLGGLNHPAEGQLLHKDVAPVRPVGRAVAGGHCIANQHGELWATLADGASVNRAAIGGQVEHGLGNAPVTEVIEPFEAEVWRVLGIQKGATKQGQFRLRAGRRKAVELGRVKGRLGSAAASVEVGVAHALRSWFSSSVSLVWTWRFSATRPGLASRCHCSEVSPRRRSRRSC